MFFLFESGEIFHTWSKPLRTICLGVTECETPEEAAMSKKEEPTKIDPKSPKKSPQELTDDQLERVAGGLDGVKGEVVEKEHKANLEIK